ncbi:MAG TPA: OsmC family protein [Syntrophales bacterium]|nr:OsmC family protein [Syntrophales bacterium]
MAKMKNVSIEAKLDDRFKVEVKAGSHTLYVDQPTTGGGTDAGPNPIECLFTALAGCIATTARIIAIQSRYKLNGMKMKVEGTFDQETILGKSKENRAGVEEIKVTLDIDADMTKEEKDAFVHHIETRCPISDNIGNITPIKIEIS